MLYRYSGILNSDMAGYYRSSYTDAAGVKKIMGSTQVCIYLHAYVYYG